MSLHFLLVVIDLLPTTSLAKLLREWNLKLTRQIKDKVCWGTQTARIRRRQKEEDFIQNDNFIHWNVSIFIEIGLTEHRMRQKTEIAATIQVVEMRIFPNLGIFLMFVCSAPACICLCSYMYNGLSVVW